MQLSSCSASCLGDALLAASGQSQKDLDELNQQLRSLRDAFYRQIGGWNLDRTAGT